MGRKLSASLISTLTLEGTLPQFKEQIWTQVCSSVKIAGGGATQHFLAEYRNLSVLNVMDLTNQRITTNSGGTAKQTKNYIHLVSKQRRVNHAPTCSNVPTVGEIIKPILTNAHSGGIASTENGTRWNTLKYMTTGSNQFALQKASSRKYDFEESQNPFSKHSEKPSYHQYHPQDTVILWHNLNPRTTIDHYPQGFQYFK